MSVMSRLDGSEILALVAIGGGLLVGLLIALTAIVTYHWRRLRQLEGEASLKQEMVRRGMSVGDIERVIRVSGSPPAEADSAPKEKAILLKDMTPRQLDALVATELAGIGADPETIDRAMGPVTAADRDTKLAVAEAVRRMIENETDEEQILASVLALCKRSPVGITEL
jgi:hypothetical protein